MICLHSARFGPLDTGYSVLTFCMHVTYALVLLHIAEGTAYQISYSC